MKFFNSRFQALLESLKNPKNNPCWKGYKPVGTKQKDGKQVPNCVPKESTSVLSRYRITGEFIFTNPNGTGRKHQLVSTTVLAYSPEQAALKAAKEVAHQKRFSNSIFELNRGYKVAVIPQGQPAAARLPYKDD